MRPAARGVAYDGSSPLTRGKRSSRNRTRAANRLIPADAGKTCVRRHAVSPTTAHPRSRGENGSTWSVDLSSPGSSPLTRGKPDLKAETVRAARLIPAHAGKTGARRGRDPNHWAHPRSRGENLDTMALMAEWGGSSPLTRGKLLCVAALAGCVGLIPAHAGKTTRR